MRYINAFVSILFVLLLSCSFPTTSGTGHEGEARVMGIAYTSTGVYRNGEIFIAEKGYLPSTSRNARAEGRYDTTDGYGRFNIKIEKDVPYILSGNINSELLYQEIAPTSVPVELGSVYYSQGTEVTVHPAENSDTAYTHLLVPGTDWIFNLSPDNSTNVPLPKESISVVRRGTYVSNNETIPLNDTTEVDVTDSSVIGKEITLIDTSLSYSFPDSIPMGSPCSLTVNNYVEGDFYEVVWDDTTMHGDSLGAFTHTYFMTGIQVVQLTRFRDSTSSAVTDSIRVY